MRFLAELLWGEDPYLLPVNMPPNIALDGTLYKIFPKGSGTQTFTFPPGKLEVGDGILSIIVWDTNSTPPTFTSPVGTTVLSHNTIDNGVLGTTGDGGGGGSGISVIFSSATITQPTISWSTALNSTVGLLYSVPLPSRFVSATKQIMGLNGIDTRTILNTNDLQVTFTAPFNGYYFTIQGMDVLSGAGSVPGTVAPLPDQTYGVGLTSTAGSWLSPGSFIVPNAIQKNGGVIVRIDYSYLTMGQVVTVGNETLINTPKNAGQYITVVGFDTAQ